MINKENITELSFISDLIRRNIMPPTKSGELVFGGIIIDAIKDAIMSDNNQKQNISSIIQSFPNLYNHLKNIVEENYPEYNDYLQKLLVLI